MKPYFNKLGRSQQYPYEVIRIISSQTVLIRRMDTESHPDWKPDFSTGGFAGHCHNQHEQKWIYKSNPDYLPFRIRKKKDGFGWTFKGQLFFPSDTPIYFYDYNF